MNDSIMLRTPFLAFVRGEGGLYLMPTDEGIEEAKDMLDNPHRDPERDLSEMLEYAMGNGWSMVHPKDIGALTDAPIISEDGFIGDDGCWYAYPEKLRIEGEPDTGTKAWVYAHMNYAVEDPIETWAEGKLVFFVRSEVIGRDAYRDVCREMLRQANE